MRTSGLSAADKSAVTAACQQLIDDVLRPRFLPTIRPTHFNFDPGLDKPGALRKLLDEIEPSR